jgi:uncharacterized protein
MLWKPLLLMFVLMLGAGCGGGAGEPDFRLRRIKLPNGDTIFAEPVGNQGDMMRGLMFRNELKPNHGMLFLHQVETPQAYWMFQVRIPLDIIWIDRNRRIVEIVANAQPCMAAKSGECPNYGGTKPAQYVLEIAGGEVAKRGLAVGQVLDF